MLWKQILCVFTALVITCSAVNRIPTHAVDEIDGSVTNLLSEILATLETTAATASNDIATLTAAVETNAFLDSFNANVGNINITLTSNAFFNLLGTNIAYQPFATNAYAATTNLTAGISNIYVTIDDADAVVMLSVDANSEVIALLSNNFDTINANFNYVSNDFNTLQGYLTTNTDAVIPLINSNMYITITNFTWVNENYVSWSNGIYAMALALSQSIYGFTGTPTVTLPYTPMSTTNYSALSTNLVFTFPNNMSNTISDLSSSVASGLFYVVTTSNANWLSALQSANDVLNDNFSAISNAYTETSNVVNQNSGVVSTNAAIANHNENLISNCVYRMGSYIRSSFLSLTNSSVSIGSISNAMGWDYPWVAEGTDTEMITNDIVLGSLDLFGAMSGIATSVVNAKTPAIVSSTITQIVIQPVSTSPWGAYGVPTSAGTAGNYFGYYFVADTNDNPWKLNPGSGGFDCYYPTGSSSLAKGLYVAQGHWGNWTDKAFSTFMFGGYPPTAEDPPRKYLYLNTGDRMSGEFSFMFSVDDLYSSVGIYTAVTNRSGAKPPPIYIQFMKIGVSE